MSALCNSFILFYFIFFWLGCITDERTDKTVFVRVVMNGSPIYSLQRVWFFLKRLTAGEKKKKQKQERHHLPVITSSYKNLHFVFFFLQKMALKELFFFLLLLLSLIVQLCNNLVGGLAMTAGPHKKCWTSWRVDIFFFIF